MLFFLFFSKASRARARYGPAPTLRRARVSGFHPPGPGRSRHDPGRTLALSLQAEANQVFFSFDMLRKARVVPFQRYVHVLTDHALFPAPVSGAFRKVRRASSGQRSPNYRKQRARFHEHHVQENMKTRCAGRDGFSKHENGVPRSFMVRRLCGTEEFQYYFVTVTSVYRAHCTRNCRINNSNAFLWRLSNCCKFISCSSKNI